MQQRTQQELESDFSKLLGFIQNAIFPAQEFTLAVCIAEFRTRHFSRNMTITRVGKTKQHWRLYSSKIVEAVFDRGFVCSLHANSTFGKVVDFVSECTMDPKWQVLCDNGLTLTNFLCMFPNGPSPDVLLLPNVEVSDESAGEFDGELNEGYTDEVTNKSIEESSKSDGNYVEKPVGKSVNKPKRKYSDKIGESGRKYKQREASKSYRKRKTEHLRELEEKVKKINNGPSIETCVDVAANVFRGLSHADVRTCAQKLSPMSFDHLVMCRYCRGSWMALLPHL
jgi:hypothetical protein